MTRLKQMIRKESTYWAYYFRLDSQLKAKAQLRIGRVWRRYWSLPTANIDHNYNNELCAQPEERRKRNQFGELPHTNDWGRYVENERQKEYRHSFDHESTWLTWLRCRSHAHHAVTCRCGTANMAVVYCLVVNRRKKRRNEKVFTDQSCRWQVLITADWIRHRPSAWNDYGHSVASLIQPEDGKRR